MIFNKRRKIRKTHRFHNVGTAQAVTKDFREHSAGVDHIDYNAYARELIRSKIKKTTEMKRIQKS